MSVPAVFVWPAADTEAVALTQTLAGAGNLTLNGNLALASSAPPSITFNGISRIVTLTSLNNLGAVNFTITGYYHGSLISETIAGPVANTVVTTALFDSVTSISTDAAAAAVSAGSGATGRTHWYNFNYHATVLGFSAQVVVTNSPNITYSFITTLDDVNTIATPTTFTPIAAMTAANTTQFASYNTTQRYCCINITAATTGSLTATFLQQGIM